MQLGIILASQVVAASGRCLHYETSDGQWMAVAGGGFSWTAGVRSPFPGFLSRPT